MILALVISLLLLSSCTTSFVMPAVRDERLEHFVAQEAAKILEVSESAQQESLYKFRLVKFPREDILGVSVGSQRIFMSYELTRLAYEQRVTVGCSGMPWLTRSPTMCWGIRAANMKPA
jgi:hypothetical protein